MMNMVEKRCPFSGRVCGDECALYEGKSCLDAVFEAIKVCAIDPVVEGSPSNPGFPPNDPFWNVIDTDAAVEMKKAIKKAKKGK